MIFIIPIIAIILIIFLIDLFFFKDPNLNIKNNEEIIYQDKNITKSKKEFLDRYLK